MSYEYLKGWEGGILALLAEELHLLKAGLGIPISIAEIKDIAGIHQALACIAIMQRCHVYRGQSLGIIDPNRPATSLSRFRKGQVILFEEQPNNRLTVLEPYCQAEINNQIANGHLIFYSTTINVPPIVVRPIGSAS